MVQRDRREYYKQWYQANKERKSAYSKRYDEQHKHVRKEQKDLYNPLYYQENSTRMIENARKRQEQSREFVRQLKAELSCVRCGIDDWRVLDFHHLDRRTKDFSLANAVGHGYSKERLLEEIAKCEVLCSNCHRIRHWEERQG